MSSSTDAFVNSFVNPNSVDWGDEMKMIHAQLIEAGCTPINYMDYNTVVVDGQADLIKGRWYSFSIPNHTNALLHVVNGSGFWYPARHVKAKSHIRQYVKGIFEIKKHLWLLIGDPMYYAIDQEDVRKLLGTNNIHVIDWEPMYLNDEEFRLKMISGVLKRK